MEKEVQKENTSESIYLRYIKKRAGLLKKDIRRHKTSYLFILPYCLLFTVFILAPVLVSIGLSFTYFNVLETPRFVGWQNYVDLFFADEVFLTAVKNTFLFAVITGPIGYFMALFIAWMINDIRNKKIRAFMTLLFYAPTISGQAYIVWKYIFSSDTYGFANAWLMKLGITYSAHLWFEDQKYIVPILIIVVLWMSMGTGFLSFIAGLQNVDQSLYEAGYMDGVKNRFQELWYITLPSMKPQLMFGAVMQITSSFAVSQISLDLVGFPSVNYAGHTIMTHLHDYGNLRYEMGYACTIAVLLFMIMLFCNILVQKLLRKLG